MIGPMKKKVITTGIVAFLIPTIVFVALFMWYSNQKKKEIEELKIQTHVTNRYVFSGDMPIEHIVTSSDLKVVGVKEISAPWNSFKQEQLNEIIGRRLKIDAKDKTIVTESMFYTEDDELEIDVRSKEFNMITLPSDLRANDFVDIRVTLPTGEDYTVIAGTEVKALGSSNESNTIFLNVDEEDILRLNSAIIESYISKDAIEVYAIKIVNPSQQLFDYETVDLVKKYEDAVNAIIESSKTIEEVPGPDKREPIMNASGDPVRDEEGRVQYEMVSGDMITIEKYREENEITVDEIVLASGIEKEIVEIIKTAKEANDKDILEKYRSYLVTTRTPIVENYPVREEVAKLLAKDPNIIDEIRVKYNVEALEAERDTFINTSIWKVDELTGEIIEDEDAMNEVRSSLQEKINTQKEERRNYLQSLLRGGIY